MSAASSLARRTLHALNNLLPDGRGGLTVLAYHLVGAETPAVVDISTEVFEGHLDELEACGRVVGLEEGLTTLTSRGADDEHLIALTFDDGYRNFYDTIWPRLRERSLPATLYVPPGFVEGSTRGPITGAETLPPVDWDQIAEIAASDLIAIGSHTLSHPDLRGLAEADCRHEFEESQRILAERSGRPVRSLCYPKALTSPAVKSLAAELYDSAVVGGGQRNRPGNLDRYEVQRLPIRRDMPQSLGKLLRKSVWLEERVAARARSLKG
jgi:peptidoglycan/xylan/chitin deacetylase (PgdA/CDA1 family)